MQDYNTNLNPIKLPEYGRNIQKIVDYCVNIPEKEKRTKFAYLIIQAMQKLISESEGEELEQQALWDHLAVLSDFKLDIDYPVEIVKPESLATKPEPISFEAQSSKMKYKMYGRIIEGIIQKACEMEDPEQRIRLFELCANQMKLNYHKTNKDADENDNKIIQDLIEYTGDQYKDEIYHVFLYSIKELMVNDQYAEAASATSSKKKKKKKK